MGKVILGLLLVLCVLALVGSGICVAMGVAMSFGGKEEQAYGMVFLIFCIPVFLVSGGVGWLLFKVLRQGPKTQPAVPDAERKPLSAVLPPSPDDQTPPQ